MAISRMQNSQQLQGIGSLRQPYGLGKLVKKAFKGVKKIAKSPIGKMALLGGLGFGLNKFGLGASKIGQNWFGNLMGKELGSRTLGGWANRIFNPWQGGGFSGKHAFGLGAGALIAAPFIQKALGYGPYEDIEEEVDDWTVTPSSVANVRNMARMQDPSLAFLPASNYVQSGFYAADGGRAHRKGFFEGALVDTAEGQPMSPGTSASGGTHEGGYGRDDVPLGGEHGTVILPDPDSPQIILNEPELTGFQKFKNWIGRRGDEEVVDENAAIIPTSGYESLAGDLGNQRVAEKAAADIWKEYNTGGRVGLLNGGEAGQAQMEQMLRAEYMKYRNKGGTMPYEQFKMLVMRQAQQGQMPNQMMAADGGRAGYLLGGEIEQETDFIEGPQGDEEFSETVVEEVGATDQQRAMVMDLLQRGMDHTSIAAVTGLEESDVLSIIQEAQAMATGGRAGFQMGGSDDDDELTYNPYRAMDMYKRTRRQEGGLMDLGGQEKDYRDEGGFVALGGEERADDVPARLSKNEFVFTADAVRNAGGGDIDRGSEVMQNLMDNLEAGGEVSEESQGLEGGEEIMSEEIIDESNPAQGMFDNYEQLQSRVA